GAAIELLDMHGERFVFSFELVEFFVEFFNGLNGQPIQSAIVNAFEALLICNDEVRQHLFHFLRDEAVLQPWRRRYFEIFRPCPLKGDGSQLSQYSYGESRRNTVPL